MMIGRSGYALKREIVREGGKPQPLGGHGTLVSGGYRAGRGRAIGDQETIKFRLGTRKIFESMILYSLLG